MDPVQFLKCISFFSLDRIIIYWNGLYDLRSLVGLPVWFCWTTTVCFVCHFCLNTFLIKKTKQNRKKKKKKKRKEKKRKERKKKKRWAWTSVEDITCGLAWQQFRFLSRMYNRCAITDHGGKIKGNWKEAERKHDGKREANIHNGQWKSP